jgi:uncharacterized protein (DUF427 family)
MTDHIKITPSAKHVRVIYKGKVVADSKHALELREGTYPVAYYVPRADADMSLLKKTAHHTTCPWKGEASYFSIVADGAESENAIWTYETPKTDVAAIKEHLAFYPNRVDAIEII